jgi:hypothetical protein
VPELERCYKMEPLLALPLCLLIAACSSTDVSRTSPFSSVSHQSVPILRTVCLKLLNEGLILGDGISFLRRPSFELTDRGPDVPHRVLATGTKVHLTSIQDEVLIDGRLQVAYGSTALADGTEADFAYRWGFHSTLKRAPWESSSVPDRRGWKSGSGE